MEEEVEVARAITSSDLQQMADCFNLPLEEIKGGNIEEWQKYIFNPLRDDL